MCGAKFASREEVRHHYIDKGCFRCKKCQLALGSRRLLRVHLREDHTNGDCNALVRVFNGVREFNTLLMLLLSKVFVAVEK